MSALSSDAPASLQRDRVDEVGQADPRPAGRPDLSVIVVTHNRPQLALRTLRTAIAAGKGLQMEWIVIDSGSTDGTPELLREAFPDLRLLRERNIGFAAASNVGLERAHGRWLLLLNPDVEIVSGTFAQLIATLEEQPEIGAASVLQLAPDGSLLHSIRRFPSPGRALGEALGASRCRPLRGCREEESRPEAYRRRTPADWLVGAFLVVRAQALADVGPLDECFFLYSEEADWCARAARAGWQVEHLPAMTLVHHTEQGVSRPDLWAQLSWAKVLFARKHLSRSAARSLRAALALRHALRTLAAGALPGSAHRARAERHALAVVLGLAPPPFATPKPPDPHSEAAAHAAPPR